jgi:hypothetical protein
MGALRLFSRPTPGMPNVGDDQFQVIITNLSETGVELAWNSMAGQEFKVQYTDNLSGVGWSDTGISITANASETRVTAPLETIGPYRFYRVVRIK